MAAPTCYIVRHEGSEARAEPRRYRALSRRDGAPRARDQDRGAASAGKAPGDPRRIGETEEDARYSSSINRNLIWRGGSAAGGRNFGFCRLERDGFVGFFAPTSPPIGEPLADDAPGRLRHALIVVYPERNALVVAEIKFRQVAVKVLLRNMVVHAVDAAFQDRKVVFGVVGVPKIGADIFLG
jgi:hypothetical protein